MRPREEIARLSQENEGLRAMLGLANARLRSADLGEVHHVAKWAIGLTRQQAMAMEALITAYPRTLDMFDLDDAVPHNDHAADRNVSMLAKSIVLQLRIKLGRDCIQTVFGVGYRVSPEFLKVAKTEAKLPPVHDMC